MRNRKWNKVLGLVCAFALLVAQLATGGLTSVVGEETGMASIALENGDFETGDSTNWTLTGFSSVTTDIWAENNETNMLSLWLSDEENTYGSAAYTVALTAGTYAFGFDLSGDTWDGGLTYQILDASGNALTVSTSTGATIGWDKWTSYTTEEFTLTEDTEVTFVLSGTVAAWYWGYLDNLTLSGTGSIAEETVEPSSIALENGDFETGDSTNWTLTGFSSVTTDIWAENNETNMLSLWLSDEENTYGSAAYTVALTAGTYAFGFDLSGDTWDGGLTYQVLDASGNALTVSTSTGATIGWDKWTSYTTEEFTLTEDTEVTFILSGTVAAWYWGYLDNLTLTGTGSLAETDTTVYDAEINVEKVDGLSDDFVMGMDISSIISEFDSGVTYKDFDGNVIDNVTDFCKFLAEDCGITHVRVRVWNDPYDSEGNGYGGGNNDVATAVKIAEACKAAGLSLLVDFHYSDFWADPSKQDAPKAWSEYTLEQKETAIADFTADSLTKIAATGVDIAMVQIGNETTGGLCGETSVANMCTLFNAASAAIRSFDDTIQIVVHVTNPESGKMTTWAKNLYDNNVDYDILATSYYIYWHGTLSNLISEMKEVQETYGKDVMVAETSYAYTLEDTDGHDNTVREGSNDTGMDYAFTVQGQADCIRDVIAAISGAGGLGVFYWEPAWITVGDTTGLTGDEYDAQVAANKLLWEQYGSGWASSYSADYDPDDAGVWYGGSAVDNQAMFYADGTPTDSLKVWNYVKTGAVSNDVSVDSIATVEETIYIDGEYELPDTVTVTYNTGSVEETVVWNTDDINEIDVTLPGTYKVTGTVTLSQEITTGTYEGCTTVETTYALTVKEANLITDADDAGFESGENFTTVNATIPNSENVYEGSCSMHWYQASEATGSATYDKEITLEAGWYTFEVAAMGAAGDTVAVSILDTEGNELFAGDAVTLTGWTSNTSEWLTPYVTFHLTEETTVKLNVSLGITAGGWGGVDAMYLHQHETVDYESNEDGTHTVSCVDCGEVLATETCTNTTYTSNGDGTYQITCNDCKAVLETGTENTESGESTETAGSTESTGSTETAGSTESGESTESTESTVTTESTESTEKTDDTEDSEDTEDDGEVEDSEDEEDTEDANSVSATLSSGSVDGAMLFAFTLDSADSEDYIVVEITDDESGAYIYAASNGECYYVSADGTSTEITPVGDAIALGTGITYSVMVEQDDNNIEIYFLGEDGEILLYYLVENTDFSSSVEATLTASDGVTGTVEFVGAASNEEENSESEDTGSESTQSSETEDSSDSTAGDTSTDASNNSGSNSSSPKTGDASPVIPIAAALFGCVAIIMASKKRMA